MRIKIPTRIYSNLTKEKARMIAHLIGDGCVYRYKHDYVIKYEVVDSELLDQFMHDLEYIYGLKTYRGLNPSGKTGRLIPFIRLRSKLVYEDLSKYATYFSKDWKIHYPILKSNSTIKREFLKALFDDEGSVIPNKGKAFIRLYSINLNGLKQVQSMLEEFDIRATIQEGFGAKRNVYALRITNMLLFYLDIGFNLKRKQDRLNEFLPI